MKDIFGHSRTTQEWSVQVTYPRTMRPEHTETFCSWWKKMGALLDCRRLGADTKDDGSEVLIETYCFKQFEPARDFCQYTASQFDKWSGPGSERRYTIKLRGQLRHKDKTEGRVGEGHPGLKRAGG